jgi:hypothetical protein
MKGLRRLENVQAGAPTHLQVTDDDIEESFVELLNGGVTVRRFLDVVRGFGERLREASAKRVVVVGD